MRVTICTSSFVTVRGRSECILEPWEAPNKADFLKHRLFDVTRALYEQIGCRIGRTAVQGHEPHRPMGIEAIKIINEKQCLRWQKSASTDVFSRAAASGSMSAGVKQH
jgi:hypothetical protein